jgi:hypothetical protein
MIFQGNRDEHSWWFRIFGWGLRCVDHRFHAQLFSERNGHGNFLHLGHRCIAVIRSGPIWGMSGVLEPIWNQDHGITVDGDVKWKHIGII